MNTTSIPGATVSAVPEAAFPTPSSSPTTEVADQFIVAANDAAGPRPDDALATTRVTATAVTTRPGPALALPQGIGLRDVQRIALQALAAGNNAETAAQMAGVNPITVYRWKKHDPRFIAALNAWRAESQRTAHDMLLAAAGSAARNVLRAAEAGDVRTSLILLKGIGALAPKNAGSAVSAMVARELSADAALIRQTIAPRPKKVSLHLLEEIFKNMDMDEQTRAAYQAAFALHRAALKPGPNEPLLRPVTPDVLRQAALAMQPTPGRAFKFAAEPSLAETKKYQDYLRQTEAADGKEEPDGSPVPAHLQPIAPMPVFPPKFCKTTITAATMGTNAESMLAIRVGHVENAWMAKDLTLPYEIPVRIASEKVECAARILEAEGATVEIRMVYDEFE